MAANRTYKPRNVLSLALALAAVVLFARGEAVHAAGIDILTSSGTPTSSAASNYSDNGGGWQIDVANAPLDTTAILNSYPIVTLYLDLFTASGTCTGVYKVQVSADGTNWSDSGLTGLQATTTATSIAFNFPLPINAPYSKLQYGRLRRVSGNCGAGAVYFRTTTTNATAWNMVPPTGTDVTDAVMRWRTIGDQPSVNPIDPGLIDADPAGIEKPTCTVFSTAGDPDGMPCLWKWIQYWSFPSQASIDYLVQSPGATTMFDGLAAVADGDDPWCPLPTFGGGTFLGSSMPSLDMCDTADEVAGYVDDGPAQIGLTAVASVIALVIGFRFFRLFIKG